MSNPALFNTGMLILLAPELKVPMYAITLSSRAALLAFCASTAGSQFPRCGLASSMSSYTIV